jgi:hypothetical protein
MRAMTMIRPSAFLPLLALVACGPRETPQAPPGSVERTADALDRKDAAERNATVRRIEDEAEARADDSEQRIEAIEQGRAEKD